MAKFRIIFCNKFMSVVFYFTNDVSDNFYLNKILSNKNYDPQKPLCKKKKKNFIRFHLQFLPGFVLNMIFFIVKFIFSFNFLKCIFWFLGSQISPQVSDRVESHLLTPELAKRIDFPFLIF